MFLLKLVYADKDASFIYGQPTIKDRATDVLTDTPQAKTVFATSKYFFMTFADNTATIVDIGNRFLLSTLLRNYPLGKAFWGKSLDSCGVTNFIRNS